MKNKIIEKESKFINGTEDLVISLVEKYAKSNRENLDVLSERKIVGIAERAFQSERDFLFREPLEYEELYLTN